MIKNIFGQGLGENSEFSTYHPFVNLIYFAFVIGITMFSMEPVFLGTAFVLSWAYSVLLSGKKQVKFNLLFMVPMVVFMAVINTLFTHNGATVLFFINDSRITLEALIYGIAAAILLTSVIIWFSSFNVIMTSDKFIYLFGKAAPVLGLTMSMIFRFIPLLKNRYKEISMGQKCMGRHAEGGFISKARQLIKEISILISWSLEASIETADSMEARGYGLHGRTSFHLFKMTARDKAMLTAMTILGLIAAAGCAMGRTNIYFYPKIVIGGWDIFTVITYFAYTVLMVLPIITDILGEKKWQQLKLEI